MRNPQEHFSMIKSVAQLIKTAASGVAAKTKRMQDRTGAWFEVPVGMDVVSWKARGGKPVALNPHDAEADARSREQAPALTATGAIAKAAPVAQAPAAQTPVVHQPTPNPVATPGFDPANVNIDQSAGNLAAVGTVKRVQGVNGRDQFGAPVQATPKPTPVVPAAPVPQAARR